MSGASELRPAYKTSRYPPPDSELIAHRSLAHAHASVQPLQQVVAEWRTQKASRRRRPYLHDFIVGRTEEL
ncbi:hypothetical protein MATL_G00048020 [Megalops atlanticus]|uniref:Uncharacterized protein n=1 Tax=Megalops atlanticus TaxID=7932 RepID=A0A9D3QBE7_MEGAT|nr:hypothetical protein MATL_G00048020 [Megalops atlanticus]